MLLPTKILHCPLLLYQTTKVLLLTSSVIILVHLDRALAFEEDANKSDWRPPKVLNQRLHLNWTSDHQFWFYKDTTDDNRVIVDGDTETATLEVRGQETDSEKPRALDAASNRRSGSSTDETEITFVNDTAVAIQLHWVDARGRKTPYQTIPPGQSHRQHTFASHVWEATGTDGKFYGSVAGEPRAISVSIKGPFERSQQPEPRSRRPRRNSGFTSPTSDSRVRIEAGNIQWQKTAGDPWESLTADGADDTSTEAAFYYGRPEWSPDGLTLVAWKITPGDNREVHTIQSSPPDGGRAKLQSRQYTLPGDRLTHHELVAFDGLTGTPIQQNVETIDFGFPRIHWRGDHEALIQKVDRGHQRFRLFAINTKTGTPRTLHDERSSTFIWTAHGPHVPAITFLDDSDAAIVSSERSGFRHLYWLDLSGESPLRQITGGDWLVRRIHSLQETAGKAVLEVGGFYSEQDPYFRHFISVDLATGKLVALTEGDGDHQIELSRDGSHFLDSYSRVDMPPVHELRSAHSGRLVFELAKAQQLTKPFRTHRLPEVFTATGRDGTTDIWGLICFPEDYDAAANETYPVIEYIYAGPHDSHVPKSYRSSAWHEKLTSLGFIVVQIDGMGTANRSKAFHDVCWQNLRDAGFPDRIAWMKAAAEKHPAMDLKRVGIFGTSAGGQNAAGALIFHGNFYKAAVAACGCHDNRMDKASWNEQWMGYPIGPQYSDSSNIDNAEQLQGDLLLIVGELDTNVPPESTLRFVDALVRANKDFDFLMLPNVGHSDGGRYGRRRTIDFLVEKLKPAPRVDTTQ